MNSSHQQPNGTSESEPVKNRGTARRVILTLVIVVATLVLMVLPWIFLFHAPEKFAGWAASGVVLAIAVHLFLNTRKRRRALEEMMEEEEEGEDVDESTSAP